MSATERHGGALLVDCLRAQSVDRIFAVPGESYLAVLDGLHDANDIDLVLARHEGGAAFMAEAHGKLTGRPGIAMVTRGPGATNASIGVHTAMQDSSPMILFVGQIATTMRDREAFQEVDYRQFFGPIAKWVTEIRRPRTPSGTGQPGLLGLDVRASRSRGRRVAGRHAGGRNGGGGLYACADRPALCGPGRR